MIALDKISDFNEVMQFYRRALDFIQKKLRRNIKIDELRSEAKEPTDNDMISYFRALISSETLKIIQIEEKFYNSKSVNREIDRFFENKSLLKSFTVSEREASSENYKIRQLRNCLVHSEYEIRISDDGESAYLYINNGNIKGSIEIPNFINIANEYLNWYNNFCQYKDIGTLKYDSKCLEEEKNEKKAINKFVRSFTINKDEKLSEERIAILKKWIKRFGIDKFKITSTNREEQENESIAIYTMISDMINCTAQKEGDIKVFSPNLNNSDSELFGFLMLQLYMYFNNNEMQEYIENSGIRNKEQQTYLKGMENYQSFLDAKKNDELKEKIQVLKNQNSDIIENATQEEYRKSIRHILNTLSARKQFTYIETIMSLSYYIFNYIREVNKQNEIFNYFNIDISDFEVMYKEEGREHVVKRDLKSEYENEKNPNKKEKLEEMIKKYGNEVVDSSNFFSHLRNCIAHGWYKIDYSKFYNTSHIEEIEIYFPTYYPKSREKDFEVKISAKKLLDVINQVAEKVNESINQSVDGKSIELEALKEALIGKKVKTSDLQIDKQNTRKKGENISNPNLPSNNDDEGR